MHELVLLLAVIGLLLGLMAGLTLVFRKWLIRRERLIAETWGAADAPVEGPSERQAGAKRAHEASSATTCLAGSS